MRFVEPALEMAADQLRGDLFDVGLTLDLGELKGAIRVREVAAKASLTAPPSATALSS